MKTFEKNYKSPQLIEEFETVTGIKVKDNPAAFIAFINGQKLDILTDYIQRYFQTFQDKLDNLKNPNNPFGR